jgi:hypothetical protein
MVYSAVTPVSLGSFILAPGACAAKSVTLVSLTVAACSPDNVYVVHPYEAMETGLALGMPYCVTKGTLVIPVINPTAAEVTDAACTVRVLAL